MVNAKTQRPGVCNAAESLLVHRAVAAGFLPRVARALAGVTLLGDEATRSVLPGIGAATEEDFATEFLGLEAVGGGGRRPRRRHRPHRPLRLGPLRGHRDRRPRRGDRFTTEVDAAAVVVNASTRFVDGEELGLGAEIGISTQKLHARGPMGLRELTSVKYVVTGRAGAVMNRRRHRRPTCGRPGRSSRASPSPGRRASTPSMQSGPGWPGSATWPTRGSPGWSTWPTAWPSRSWSRVRPAPARPSWPSRWPGSPGAG